MLEKLYLGCDQSSHVKEIYQHCTHQSFRPQTLPVRVEHASFASVIVAVSLANFVIGLVIVETRVN